jgi:hypothetical protein
LEYVADLINKNIILANWFYTAENFEQLDIVETGSKFLLEKGFCIYGCPWDDMLNHRAWENVLNQNSTSPLFLGLMHTQWSGRNSGLAQTGAIAWSGQTWLTKK